MRVKRDLTILVLEDADDLRALISLMLETPGRRVLCAANQTEALDLARSTTIDLLVGDVVLPNLSGPRIAEQLRSLQPGLSVLYISGWYEHPQFPELGGERLLHKPFSRKTLNEAVAAVLSCRPEV